MNERRVTVRDKPLLSKAHVLRQTDQWLNYLFRAGGDLDDVDVFAWDVRDGRGSLRDVLTVATERLDEQKLRALVRKLARQPDAQSPKGAAYIKGRICCFWNEFDPTDPTWASIPGLSCWNSQSASAFISFTLHAEGQAYSLSPDAYRKTIERMRKLGAKLEQVE